MVVLLTLRGSVLTPFLKTCSPFVLFTNSLLVSFFPQTNAVFCRERDGVVIHRVESIEEAPFLNRSVEAFSAEDLAASNIPWVVSRRKSVLSEVAQ
jgi:hypothetical protein